ncbi:hypothetical protein P7C70_g4687, partial [Phenoliferia sp. Uapishka_3]
MEGLQPVELPNEVWIEILSSQDLTYYDLKRLAIFDERLFRRTPAAELPKGTHITMHPVLKACDSFIGEKTKLFVIRGVASHDKKTKWKIAELPCASELATSPSVKKINLRIAGCKVVDVESGVKVSDVIKGIAAAWRMEDYDASIGWLSSDSASSCISGGGRVLKIFDDILFRGSPTASLAEGDLIAVHPTLWEENSGLIGEDVQKFWVGNWEDDTKQFQIVKLLCASEFATCPPVNKLLLALGGEEIVENMNGVTVVDVVEGIAAAWRKQANFRVRRQDATKKYPEGSEKLMSYGEEIYRNERRFWVGWRTPRLLPDGTVVLRARPFSYWS